MVNTYSACGKSVNTLFIQLGISCVDSPTALIQTESFTTNHVKNPVFSTILSASYQRLIHRTRYLLYLIGNQGFTQYPQPLLLLKRKLKKERS